VESNQTPSGRQHGCIKCINGSYHILFSIHSHSVCFVGSVFINKNTEQKYKHLSSSHHIRIVIRSIFIFFLSSVLIFFFYLMNYVFSLSINSIYKEIHIFIFTTIVYRQYLICFISILHFDSSFRNLYVWHECFFSLLLQRFIFQTRAMPHTHRLMETVACFTTMTSLLFITWFIYSYGLLA